MSLSVLKIIGLLSMFADHYHYMIGGPEILKIIGRLAFPIFSFSVSEGYVHTRDIRRYMARLVICAVVFQLPSILFRLNHPVNIFFTLSSGLLSIIIYRKKGIHPILKMVLLFFLLWVAARLDFDYGIYGILLIVELNLFRRRKLAILGVFLILNMTVLLKPELFGLAKIQIYSLISLIPIFMYNGKKGRSLKYFFYLFYPLHFIVLEIVRYIGKL